MIIYGHIDDNRLLSKSGNDWDSVLVVEPGLRCYNHAATGFKMELSHEQVRQIARLARLGLNEEEIEGLGIQMSRMLEYFEMLGQLDTTGVPPASHINPLQNVLRRDEVVKEYSQDDVLSNAPRQAENCFQVRLVLE